MFSWLKSPFKDVEIESSFKPYLNEKNNEITWVAKNFLALPIDDEGKTIPCTSDSHDMKPFYFITNYLIQLFFTLVFHTQVQEMHLKPVKIKSKNRPHR